MEKVYDGVVPTPWSTESIADKLTQTMFGCDHLQN